MSYIDALFDREHDRIHVVERRNGKKAIKLAHKAEFGREQQDHELLEQILVTVGKTL